MVLFILNDPLRGLIDFLRIPLIINKIRGLSVNLS